MTESYGFGSVCRKIKQCVDFVDFSSWLGRILRIGWWDKCDGHGFAWSIIGISFREIKSKILFEDWWYIFCTMVRRIVQLTFVFSVVVLQLADQLLDRLHSLHSRNLIHRDIKPVLTMTHEVNKLRSCPFPFRCTVIQHNFVMGLGDKKDIVYCIDFGLAKLYCDPKTGRHNGYERGYLIF